MIAVPLPLPGQSVQSLRSRYFRSGPASAGLGSSVELGKIWVGIFVKQNALVCEIGARQPDLAGEIHDGEGDDVKLEMGQRILVSVGVPEVFIPGVPDVNGCPEKVQGFGDWKDPANATMREVSQECPQKRRSKRWKRGAGKKREGEDSMSVASNYHRQYPEDETNSRAEPKAFQ